MVTKSELLRDLNTELSVTRAFLRELAKHLEANDMPGQAGNCTIRADKLTVALHQLDQVRNTRR